MTIEQMNLTDVDYFEKMLLARALKFPAQRNKLKLAPEHFENERHSIIYTKLSNDMNVTAEDLLTDSVRNPDKFGDYEFIRAIVNFPLASEHGIENDQLQIYEFYKKRIIAETIKEYNQNPTSEQAVEVSRRIDELEKFDLKGTDNKINTLTEIMDDLYGENEQTITSTGFQKLDDIISGFEPQQLNVVAARPSMGKTAFALGLSEKLARNGAEVVFLSLESTEKNMTQRLLSSIAKVDLYKFKKPSSRMSDAEIQKVIDAMDVYNKLPLRIEEHAKLTPNKVRRIANNITEGVQGFILIDYLQLMYSDSKHNGKYEEISNISREIKMITQEMPNITIIALAQLNRGVEQRNDKRPMMSDLRDSGQIEQDSSMIMMLYRDDYYNTPEDIDPTAPSPLEVIVAKNKDGGLGTAELDFYKSIQKIY